MENALNYLFTRPQLPPAKTSISKTLEISCERRPESSLQTHLDVESSLNLGVLTPLSLPISPPPLLLRVLCLGCEFGGRSLLSSEIGSRRTEMVVRNFRKRKKLARRKGGWCAGKQSCEMWGSVDGGAPFCDGGGIRKLKFYGAVVRVVLVFSSVGAELGVVVVLPMSGGCGWVAGSITGSSGVVLGKQNMAKDDVPSFHNSRKGNKSRKGIEYSTPFWGANHGSQHYQIETKQRAFVCRAAVQFFCSLALMGALLVKTKVFPCLASLIDIYF